MISRVLLFSFFAALSTHMVYGHEYHVSISEIEYNTQQKVLEISIQLTDHDFEIAAQQAGVPPLFLGTNKEHQKADSLLFHFISDYFKITTTQKPVAFNWVGKEIALDGSIFCYITSEIISPYSTIEITNTLLLKNFEQQTNIVHFKVNDKKQSNTLTHDHYTVTYQLKE